MRGGRIAVLVVVTAVVAAGSLLYAPPASALTKKQATAIALKRLKPQREPAAIVFGLPKPLGPKATVVEATRGVVGTDAKQLGRRVWLFWEDLAPYAMFAHPSRLVLVDAATGRIVRDAIYDFWPLVNGRPPAFLTSSEAYESPRYRIYPSAALRTALPPGPVRSPADWQFAPDIPNFIPKDALKNDCLVTVGAYDDNVIGRNFDLWEGLADRIGLRTFRVKAQAAADTSPDSADLGRTLEDAVEAGCKDVVLFLSGHGYSYPGTKQKGDPVVHDETDPFRDGGTFDGSYRGLPDAVIPGVSTVSLAPGGDPFEVRPGKDDITSRELRNVFLEFTTRLTFKLVIDSCFSGRMLNDLRVERPANLLVGLASSAADEVSIGNLVVPPGQTAKTFPMIRIEVRADGKKVRVGFKLAVRPRDRGPAGRALGEFSRSVVFGILKVGTSEAAVTQVQERKGSFTAHLLFEAFSAGASGDAPRSTGATHPQSLPPPECLENRRQPLTFPSRRGNLVFQSDRAGDFELLVAGAGGGSPLPLVPRPGTDEFNPASSPSGKRIVFQSGPAGLDDFDLFVLDLEAQVTILPSSRAPLGSETPGPTPLVTGPLSDRAAQFCDEDTVVFTRTVTAADSDIWAIEVDGTGLRQLTSGPHADSFPTCHPDGRRIAFTSNRGGPPEIWEVGLDGGGLHKLIEGLSVDADYAPDGSALAYVTLDPQDGNPEVFVKDLVTGTVVQRTSSPPSIENRLPKFAPDATQGGLPIVFTRRTPVAARGTGKAILEELHVVSESGSVRPLLVGGSGSAAIWLPVPGLASPC